MGHLPFERQLVADFFLKEWPYSELISTASEQPAKSVHSEMIETCRRLTRLAVDAEVEARSELQSFREPTRS